MTSPIQITSDKPVSEITEFLKDLFTDLECELKINEKAYTIDVSHTRKDDEGHAFGMITMHAQVFGLAENLHLIEIRRGRGDIIEYKTLSDKVQEKLSHLAVVIPHPEK